MPVVDLEIVKQPSTSPYSNQFVVEIEFEHEVEEHTENESIVFPGDAKADVIEFVNFLHAADDEVSSTGQHPTEVPGYDKWCDYSEPGLSAWPTDSNGVYFASLTSTVVAYYDHAGARFEVNQVTDG